jgi:hypothetical protein
METQAQAARSTSAIPAEQRSQPTRSWSGIAQTSTPIWAVPSRTCQTPMAWSEGKPRPRAEASPGHRRRTCSDNAALSGSSVAARCSWPRSRLQPSLGSKADEISIMKAWSNRHGRPASPFVPPR